MSLEQQLATLTDEVKALSSSVSILTAAIVAMAEKMGTAPVEAKAPTKRGRKAVDASSEPQIPADPPAAEEKPALPPVATPDQQLAAANATAKAATEGLPAPLQGATAVERTVNAPPEVIAGIAEQKPEGKPIPSIGELLDNNQPPVDPAPIPTKEQVIAKFQELVAKFGKDAATEMARVIINGLGAANISGIPEVKRREAMAEVDKKLKAGV